MKEEKEEEKNQKHGCHYSHNLKIRILSKFECIAPEVLVYILLLLDCNHK